MTPTPGTTETPKSVVDLILRKVPSLLQAPSRNERLLLFYITNYLGKEHMEVVDLSSIYSDQQLLALLSQIYKKYRWTSPASYFTHTYNDLKFVEVGHSFCDVRYQRITINSFNSSPLATSLPRAKTNFLGKRYIESYHVRPLPLRCPLRWILAT